MAGDALKVTGTEPGHAFDQRTGPSTSVVGQGATFGFMELSTVFFGEGSRIFGPDDVVAVSGVIPPAFSCPGTAKGILRDPAPFPTADFYVIENSGDYLSDGATLDDVSGEPNRVVALSSGAFVDELVAIGQPSGNLPPGEYDIVMDQCMDGQLDRAGQSMSDTEYFTGQYDIVLGDGPGFAFKLLDDGTVAENLPDIDAHPLKRRAKQMSSGLGGFGPDNPDTGQPVAPGFCGGGSSLSDLSDGSTALLLTVLVQKCEDMAVHYEGIAADPPRSDYDELAEVGPIDYDTRETNTTLQRATQRLSNRFAEQAAITAALLVTWERFQGAKAADDHAAMVRQLERLDELITLLIGPNGNLYRTYAALEAFDLALRNDPELGGTAEAEQLRSEIPELRRAIGGLVDPLGPRIRHDKEEDELVPVGLQAWIHVYLGDEFLASEEGLLGIPQLRDELGLPPLSLNHPTARTTGPYTTPPNRSVELDAGPSEDPNGDALSYAWDLDADGAFDDATGVVTTARFAAAGTRLIGVRATDPDGNRDVQYTLLRVGDLTTQEVVVTHGGSRGSRALWRVDPGGNVTVIREDAPIPGTLGGLQVDLNGDIVVASSGFGTGNTSVIQRFDANGSLIRSITEAEIEAAIGQPFDRFEDLVIDGRGDIIAVVGRSNRPHMLLRISPDGSRASVIREVIDAGPDPDNNHAGIAIDPAGNLVVGGTGLPSGNISEVLACCGVAVLDPDNGSTVAMSIPPTGYRDTSGVQHHVLPTFGGERLFFTLGSNFWVTQVGIAVDDRGDYLSGHAKTVIRYDLFRIPIPAELTNLSETDSSVEQGLEIFPMLVSDDDTFNLVAGDIAIDRGGDVLMPGQDFAVLPEDRKGVWRVTPAGTAFLLADLTEVSNAIRGQPRPDKLGVVPEVRRVTPKDVPPPPSLQITDLRVNQAGCPGSVHLGVTVENTGSAPAAPPVRVEFYDGDPLADGVPIDSAGLTEPLAPGESADLTVSWPEPTPGPHQVFAWTADATGSTGFTALRVCGSEDLPRPLTLAPTTATNTIGAEQTFVANASISGEPVVGLAIRFDVTGANPTTEIVTTNASGIATFTYTGRSGGDDTVIATMANATAVRTRPARVSWVEATNRAPTAAAGGPYVVSEGDELRLNGSSSADPDGDPLSYTWRFQGRSFDGAVVDVRVDDDVETEATLTVDDGRGGSDTDSAAVTVVNVAPTVDAGSDRSAAEGESIDIVATFDDAGGSDTHTATIDWGDGTVDSGHVNQTAGTVAGSHTYADDGTYTVTVEVTDDDGGVGNDTLTATVHNVAPTVDAGSNRTTAEGATVSLTASFTDPGVTDRPWSVTWDFGDGAEPVTVATDSQGTLTVDHVYGDDGTFEVEVCVTDKDGDTGCDGLSVTVHNVPPEVTAVGPDTEVIDEGDAVALAGTFVDPGLLDTHNVTVDWGDGADEARALPFEARQFELGHTYLDNRPDNAPYAISASVDDDDGGTDTATTEVTVENVPPVVTDLALADSTVREGDVAVLTGAFTDPGVLDTHEVEVHWGDGSTPTNLRLPGGDRTFSSSHRYLDNPPGEPTGNYTIVVTVTDKDGGEGATSTPISVRNVPPTVSATGDAISEGGTATVSANFTDPGVLDTHTATVDWGDGTPPEEISVRQGAGLGNLTASHTYGDDGDYPVTVTVTDDDGGVGTQTAVVQVVNVAPTVDLNTEGTIAFDAGTAYLGRVGVEQSHEAGATDPGSDDLTFGWDFEVNAPSRTYFNDGAGPDADLSPGGTFPFSATDTADVTFGAPGIYLVEVVVTDDDGGANLANRSKLVTGDAAETRSMGFWRHQYSGQGRAHYSDAELAAFLDAVNYASGVYSERADARTFDAAHDTLSPRGPGMRVKAEAQALAGWLNFAAGGVDWNEEIDTDGDGDVDRAFFDVIGEVESILTDSDASSADLERAKDLAEAINTHDQGSDGGNEPEDGEGNGAARGR